MTTLPPELIPAFQGRNTCNWKVAKLQFWWSRRAISFDLLFSIVFRQRSSLKEKLPVLSNLQQRGGTPNERLCS